MSSIHIEKRDEVKRIFEMLPFRLTTGLSKVVDAMMTPYVREMKRLLLPVKRSGLLRSSIKKRITIYELGTLAFGIVGPDRNVRGQTKGGKSIVPANYAHLVDLGTKPHFLSRRDTGAREQVLITPRNGNRKPYYKSRKVYERFGKLHPGAKPHAFRQPAYLAGRAASLAAGEKAAQKLIGNATDPTKKAA